MRIIKLASLAASTSFVLFAGLMAMPQMARAETCALVKSGNAFSINANDNTYNPSTNPSGATTSSNTACGDGSTVTGTDATATGANTTAASSSTAVGANSSATGTNSVALGQGSSDGGQSNVVSVGTVSLQRRITNVAAGTLGTDAVNLNQLMAAVATGNPYLAFQGTGAPASATGTNATAIGVGAVASAPNSVALGTGSIANAANTVSVGSVGNERRVVNVAPGTVSATSTDAVNGSQLYAVQQSTTTLASVVTLNHRQTNGGVAAAMAMGGTIMPGDATLAVSFNLATYRGEQGFSTAVTAKAGDHVYISAGFSGSTVKGSAGGRVGMTLAW